MREIEKNVFVKIMVVLERNEQYLLTILFNYERNRKKSFVFTNFPHFIEDLLSKITKDYLKKEL